ncbi:response regulator transcription factor [soil metagenome]
MKPIRIAIVDDNKANRSFISERIIYDGTIEVIFNAHDGDHFLQMMKVHSSHLPDAVLMDIEMPGMNGIEAVQHGAVLYPAVKFLMLTVLDSDDKIFEAIKAGASGYLLKDEKVSVILNSLHQLIEFGAAPMSPRIARKALDLLSRATLPTKPVLAPQSDFNISDREKEILRLLVDGHDYKFIAEKLYVSPHTVRNHIAHIYHKLHVKTKMQAIKLAASSKLL